MDEGVSAFGEGDFCGFLEFAELDKASGDEIGVGDDGSVGEKTAAVAAPAGDSSAAAGATSPRKETASAGSGGGNLKKLSKAEQADLKKVTVTSITGERKKGFLTKCGGKRKTWKKRFCVLKDGQLMYFKDDKKSGVQGIVALAGSSTSAAADGLKETKGKKNSFSITTGDGGRTFYMFSPSPEETKSWIEALTAEIACHLHAAPQLPPSMLGSRVNGPTITLYPLENYTFGIKEPQHEKDGSVAGRMARMKETVEREGQRRSVFGVLLVHQHGHPHVLLLQIGNSFFKLPGGRLKPGHEEVLALQRKLSRKLAPNVEGYEPEWEIGELIAKWYRPNYENLMYPYVPAHITKPKECKKIFAVQLPERCKFAVPKNLKLLAVPLFELYDNDQRYGNVISSLAHSLSRCNFVYL